jgi:hypothetical protein
MIFKFLKFYFPDFSQKFLKLKTSVEDTPMNKYNRYSYS